MVLRIPQFEEAEARFHAAEADVEKARRDLERTDIRAPYAGRILEQRVDVGQYVSTGTQLGRAFSTDVMEVRLPLTNQHLGFIDLPETFRETSTPVVGPDVAITAKIGRSKSSWNGRIVRVDSSIDENSRQLFVVAQIEDPYRAPPPGGAALKIGMFVDAIVEGRKLRDVFVLPRSSVRVSGEVILIDSESKIQRRKVSPIWKGETEVVIAGEGGGIADGDVLCLTPLAYPANGTLVLPTIDGVPPKIESIPGLNMSGKGKGKSKGASGKGEKGKRPKGSFSGQTKEENTGS
jgi:multidrug efflux pump subunit AcrA (membrane-fusion protein)